MRPRSDAIRSLLAVALAAAVASEFHCGSLDPNAGSGGDAGSCVPPDEDGMIGGPGTTVFQLYVNDDAFYRGGDAGTSPILTAQNRATVQLTLTNTGTRPHDFSIDCYPTPNSMGCPTRSCFPPASSIPSLAPGKSATVTFAVPMLDGVLYTFRSNLPGDTQTGQFNVI
jgi:hypothetical protein